MKRSFVYIGLLSVSLSQNVFAQETKSLYNHNNVFDPLFFTHDGNEFRSANGAPGPKYWQNSANYIIHVALDESDSTLRGAVVINYTNKSQDTLNYLWLQLDQNLFDTGSRGAATTIPTGDRFDAKRVYKGRLSHPISIGSI